jgi:hypothetical protein
VDKDGLREATGHLPPERLVFELIQNALDENSTTCTVTITQQKLMTRVSVSDDNPDGFKDLSDAHTLFRSTGKRSDPTKRGRFNLGEKIVFARAIKAAIITTKGTVSFDQKGRHESAKAQPTGSTIVVDFPRWKEREFNQCIDVLRSILIPKGYKLTLNGEDIPYRGPKKVIETTLATEVLKDHDGTLAMTRTRRKTTVHFHPACREKAHLYEMGLPVCPIDGRYDADVQQKIPQSQDRTLVSDSYIQDIYAEMLTAFQDDLDEQDLGSSAVKAALEDDRVAPDVAQKVFRAQFGDNAVIQSPFDPDANQEAARAGAMIVSGRTFGSAVNDKLRSAGIQTTTEAYSRDRDVLTGGGLMPDGYKDVADNPAREQVRKFVDMLSRKIYGRPCAVSFAQWFSSTLAIYQHGAGITFNVRHPSMAQIQSAIVSRGSAPVLHELAHCMGSGHQGVYDHEFERAVNVHTSMLARAPQLYAPFEPRLFPAFRGGAEKPDGTA